MALASRNSAIVMLKTIGFDNAGRNFAGALANFQRGWNLGTALAVDGKYGPKSDAALKVSYARARKGQSTMSAHFSFVEFRCNCGGRYASCARIWEDRRHVRRLEAYRTKVGSVRIISGCRCIGRNRDVGGATSSQHLYGFSSDIAGLRSVTQMRSYRLFAGLGYNQSSGRVVHADSRDLSGHNGTRGTTAAPTVWKYGR
jgi:hypothetical protein